MGYSKLLLRILHTYFKYDIKSLKQTSNTTELHNCSLKTEHCWNNFIIHLSQFSHDKIENNNST